MFENPIIINTPNEYLNETFPYIFLDKAYIDGQFAFGYKHFTSDEWYFKCHFPAKPVVPAVFQIDAMAQLAIITLRINEKVLKSKNIILKKYTNINIYKPVFPSDTVGINTEILSNTDNMIQVKALVFSLNKDSDKNNIPLLYNKERHEIHCEGEFTLKVM